MGCNVENDWYSVRNNFLEIISKRYSKSDDNTEVMYWDANNLYVWAMIQDLPY